MTVLPSSETSQDSARSGCRVPSGAVDQQRVIECVERGVVPIGADRIELGEVEIVALAQRAAGHWLILRQGRGGGFASQKLTQGRGGDAESRRSDQEITPGQATRAVSREELVNRDAGIHSYASL